MKVMESRPCYLRILFPQCVDNLSGCCPKASIITFNVMNQTQIGLPFVSVSSAIDIGIASKVCSLVHVTQKLAGRSC